MESLQTPATPAGSDPHPDLPGLSYQQFWDLQSRFGGRLEKLGPYESCWVIAHPPRREHVNRFFSGSERNKFDAMDRLVKDCTVYPDAVALDAMINDFPGVAVSFSNDLLKMSALTQESLRKKL
jgi:hypothetical protein